MQEGKTDCCADMTLACCVQARLATNALGKTVVLVPPTVANQLRKAEAAAGCHDAAVECGGLHSGMPRCGSGVRGGAQRTALASFNLMRCPRQQRRQPRRHQEQQRKEQRKEQQREQRREQRNEQRKEEPWRSNQLREECWKEMQWQDGHW